MSLNKLTERLLAEGWSPDQTPPGCRPYKEYYGGWAYDYQHVKDWVFETPCGLLVDRGEIGHSGQMYYMGVDWCEENDCATIICPRYSMEEVCDQQHPLLRRTSAGCHDESLRFCAVHRTDRAWNYEDSAQRLRDLADAESERLWEEFKTRHKGRVCRYQSRYNRRTRTWSAFYNPEQCARMGVCRYCVILNKELDTKKGNVFYDIKRTFTVPGEGLIPDEERSIIRKGEKLLDRTVSLTICEAIVKYGRHNVISRYMLNHHWAFFNDPSLKIELLNFRPARTDTRDLMQDLEDVAAGIKVTHSADEEKLAREQKRKKMEASAMRKAERLEKLVLEQGRDLRPDLMRRARKFLGEDRVRELLRERERIPDEPVQMDLFGGAV